MKKLLISVLALLLSLAMLVSCDSLQENGNGKTARECSDSLVSLMGEMVASEEYEKMYGLSFSYKDKIDLIKGGDYSKISAVYELSIPDSALISGLVSFDGMSDKLEDYVRSNMLSTIATRVNQRDGVAAVAVASAFTASESFVCPEIKSDTVYLYVFESGCPILVSFVPGEDGAVKLMGHFIISSDFKVENAGEIEEMFKKFGLNGIKAK